MTHGIRLFALDLDGTLVDSAPDLAHCLGRALEAVGLPAPGETATRGWIGDGIESLLRRGLEAAAGAAPDAALTARALEAFDACYRVNLFARSRLYPEVAETLDALLARGARLCCVTNKRESFATRLLELTGLAPRLEFVLGGDSCADKKPSPVQLLAAAERTGIAPEAAVLVGDSVHDEQAARAAGFGFVWAAYGYGEPDARDANPSIRGFSELLRVVGV